MFRISRRLDYGLQLMIALANDPQNRPQSTASLAEKLKIPLPFLHQIGHMLMQSGLIKASPGPRGGIRLNRPAESISIHQIVEVLDGPVFLHPCPDCNDECERIDTCSAQYSWGEFQDVVVRYLDNVKLADMAKNAQKLPIFSMPFQDSTENIRA